MLLNGADAAPATDVTANPNANFPAEQIRGGRIIAKMLKQEGIKHMLSLSGALVLDSNVGCFGKVSRLSLGAKFGVKLEA